MIAATDNLHATAHLFVVKDSGFFSVWTTGRACLEQLGIAYWLSEPGLSPQDRLGRVINDRLISLRGAQKLVARGSIAPDAITTDPKERATQVIAQADAMGYDVASESVQPPRPSLTDLVDAITSPGTYSLTSGMAHVELWAVAHYQEAVDSGQDPAEVTREIRRMTVAVVEYQALSTILLQAFGKTTQSIAHYFGWDDSAFAAAYDRAASDVAKSI